MLLGGLGTRFGTLGAGLGTGAKPSWLIPGPDGTLPIQVSAWSDNAGYVGGQVYGSAAAYLAAAGGTFARASDAWRRDADGIWRKSTSNQLRLHHDADGHPLGALIEGQRTNYFLLSLLGNYTPNNHTLTDHPALKNVFGNPAKIDVFAPPAPSNSGFQLSVGTGISENVTAVAEIELAATPQFNTAYFGLHHNTLGWNTISTATIISGPGTLSSSGSAGMWILSGLSTTEITRLLVSVTIPPGTPTGTLAAILYPRASNSVADASCVFALRNFENAAFPSSPIATTGSAGARLADALSYPAAAPSELTVVVDAVTAPGLAGDQTLLHWDDGTADNRLRLYRDGGNGKLTLQAVAAGVPAVYVLTDAAVAHDTRVKAAISLKAGTVAGSVGADTPKTWSVPSPIPAGLTTIWEGAGIGGEHWFGTLADIRLYDKAYTPSDLPGMQS